MSEVVNTANSASPDFFFQKLISYGDVESAIAIYKEIAGILEAYENVRKAARVLIEKQMQATGELAITTGAGKASYTQPKTGKLNDKAWKAALARNPDLLRAQANYDAAKSILDNLQEAYKELPAPSLRIS